MAALMLCSLISVMYVFALERGDLSEHVGATMCTHDHTESRNESAMATFLTLKVAVSCT